MALKSYLTEAELAAVQPVTGDEFDINLREITNIETVVIEHTDGGIMIELDDAAIAMLEEHGITLEDDSQLNEFWPLVGAIAGRVAGAAAGDALAGAAGRLAGGAAGSMLGKSIGDKIDNKNDSSKQLALADEYTDAEYLPQEGDVVKVNYATEHKGQLGQVVEIAPSGKFVYVEFKDGAIESYDASTLEKVSDEEADAYFDQEADDFDESMNSIRRLAGMATKESVKSGYDKSHGGPYDRGSADAYYGRPARPHKMAPYSGADAVQGQMARVPLTDPAEIAAYNAGYAEEDDRKDWGESANEGRFDEPLTGYRIVSKKHGQVRPEKFASKDEAQKYLMTKLFANHHDYEIKSFDESVNEAEYQGRKVPLGKPMQGDVKKFKVYVKDPKTGNVKKVNFGDPNMRIKKSNPARRKSFRARHHCSNPGPRTKARYWSCRKW